jgi:hypothetical protein
MSGKAVPVASAGSKKAGVSDTWTPQVIVPSAALALFAVTMEQAATTRAATSAEWE